MVLQLIISKEVTKHVINDEPDRFEPPLKSALNAEQKCFKLWQVKPSPENQRKLKGLHANLNAEPNIYNMVNMRNNLKESMEV